MEERYGTVEGFLAYHTARGRADTVADMSDGDIEVRLLLASEFLDGAFRDQFGGYRTEPLTQVREWPRIGVIDYYGYAVPYQTVPIQIEQATYEIALRAPELNRDASPGKYKRVKIEGAIEVEYGDQSAASLQVQMPVLAQILRLLLGYRGATLSPLSSLTTRA